MVKIKKSSRTLIWMLLADFCNFQLVRATHRPSKFHPRFAGWEGCFSAKRLLFLVFILWTSQCQAATYYFSTSGNNTTGNGTQAAPYYSLCGPWPSAGCQTGENKISLGQIAVNPGDEFLFKRGDEWVGLNAQWTINAVGTSTNPIIFGAWGDSNLPRPVFRGSKTAFELGKDTWTNVAGTPIWYTSGITWWPHVASQEESAPGGPSLFGAWSVQGVTNANGWTLNQSMVRGTHFYESSTQRLYVWRTDDLMPSHAAGRDIYIGNAPLDGTDRLIKVNRGYAGTSTDPKFVGGYYEFRDLHAKMSAGYGFSSSYPNTKYINCLSELNGMEGFLFDASRFGAPAPGAKDNLLKGSVSRRNNMKQGNGIGQGITVEAPNVTIEDSESYENAWAGIDFLDYNTKTNTSGGKVINTKVHNNGIQPVSEANFDANIYIDGGRDITIQNSQVWGAGVDPRGIKTRLRPNPGICISAESPAIAVGKVVTNIKILNTVSYGNAGEALKIYSLPGNDVISNVEVVGSTFQRERGDSDIKGYYDPTVSDAGVRVVFFKDLTGGMIFKNNLVVANNTARAPLFDGANAASLGKSIIDFNNNIYYCPGCNYNTTGSFNSGGFVSYNYISNKTLDQWRNLGASASLQQDTALDKTVIASNPLLTNTTLSAFDGHLQDGSSAFDVADTSAFTFAVSGTTRLDGTEDSPYNDLGYHYPTTGPPAPPVLDTQAPTAPTSLAASMFGGQVFLEWNASTDNVAVTHYDVYNGAVELGTTSSTGYTITSTVPGQIFDFNVKAYDAAGNVSSASNTVTLTVGQPSDTTAPTAPTALAAVVSSTQVSLSWTGSTDDTAVDHYEIQNNGAAIGTSTSNVFVHNGAAGSTYNYSVKALDAAANVSNSSNIVTVTLASAATTTGPTAPTNLVSSLVNGQVQLTWGPSTGNVGYNVYRNSAYLKSVGTTSTFDNGVTNGNTYTYYIKAYDGANVKSAPSNTVTLSVGTPAPAQDTQAPTVPGSPLAALAAGQVSFSWSASSDNTAVTAYKISDNGALMSTVPVSPYLILSPVIGKTYNLSVVACDAAGNCSGSASAAPLSILDTAAPSVPSGLSALVSGTSINLSWNASTDDLAVAGYQIFENSAVIGTSSAASFSFGPVVSGATYYFTVKAFDAAGNVSGASAVSIVPVPDITPPSAPLGLQFVLNGTKAVLNWAASTDNIGVVLYQVFQGAQSVGTSVTTSFTTADLAAGQNYTFTVKALDAANNVSAPSNPVTVGMAGPSAPTNLVAYTTGSSIYVGWTTSANATGYAVYRNDVLLTKVTGGSLYDSAISAGQTYVYKVQAYDASNRYSGFSNSMTVTTPSGLGAPTNLVGVRKGTKVTLSWNAVTGATGYNVYRNGAYLKSVGLTNTSDTLGNASQPYTFYVKAYDAAGLKSDKSNEIAV